MLKKTYTYTDYDGNEKTEDFYFHMSKPDLFKMMAKFYPDLMKTNKVKEEELVEIVNNIVKDKDPIELIDLYEYLIIKSYGKKEADGSGFEKSPELERKFRQSAAYESLFMDLLTNADEMNAFFEGIMPKDVSGNVGIAKEKIKIISANA